MDNKFSLKNFKLLPKKQQRAIYTIIFSLLGFALVVILACVLIFTKGKEPNSNSNTESGSTSESSSSTDIKDPITDDKYGDTILKKQDNKDANYLKETLFIGDSNTERLMQYGHISIDNFVGKTGLSITGAASEACVYFKNDDKAYTIPQAIAMMKPRRVVITLGTNDASESVATADFVKSYTSFIKAVTDAYPHAQVIINSIPPVTKATTYKSISMEKINDFNVALADLALEKGYSFLNSSEALRDTNGYGKAAYFTKEDGVHFVDGGARVLVDFVRTHPQEGEDKRPDTKNIPSRRSAPSAASTSTTTSSTSDVEDKTITYSVQMDGKTAMGSLKNDAFDKKTTYTHTFKDETKKFSITAVAADGYTFSKWSDGVKEATRSDAVPKTSAKITANFTKIAPLAFTVDKTGLIVLEGETFTIKATVTGDGADQTKVVWKVDGTQVSTGATFTGKYDVAKTYKIEASYPGVTAVTTITVTVNKKTVTPPTPPVTETTITIGGPTDGTVGTAMSFTALVAGGADSTKTVWVIGGTTTTGATFTYTPTAISTDGSLKLTATNNGKSATVTLTIKEKPAPVKSISPKSVGADVNLAMGGVYDFHVVVETNDNGTITIDDAATAVLAWSISGTSASGTGGIGSCSFTTAGTYTLTITGGGLSFTHTINVTGTLPTS